MSRHLSIFNWVSVPRSPLARHAGLHNRCAPRPNMRFTVPSTLARGVGSSSLSYNCCTACPVGWSTYGAGGVKRGVPKGLHSHQQRHPLLLPMQGPASCPARLQHIVPVTHAPRAGRWGSRLLEAAPLPQVAADLAAAAAAAAAAVRVSVAAARPRHPLAAPHQHQTAPEWEPRMLQLGHRPAALVCSAVKRPLAAGMPLRCWCCCWHPGQERSWYEAGAVDQRWPPARCCQPAVAAQTQSRLLPMLHHLQPPASLVGRLPPPAAAAVATPGQTIHGAAGASRQPTAACAAVRWQCCRRCLLPLQLPRQAGTQRGCCRRPEPDPPGWPQRGMQRCHQSRRGPAPQMQQVRPRLRWPLRQGGAEKQWHSR